MLAVAYLGRGAFVPTPPFKISEELLTEKLAN